MLAMENRWKKEETMVVVRYSRDMGDQEKVDELALDRNGIYLHVPLQISL